VAHIESSIPPVNSKGHNLIFACAGTVGKGQLELRLHISFCSITYPVQMQSLQMMLFPPLCHPSHDSGHSILHSYSGVFPSLRLADIVANWLSVRGSALSHLNSNRLCW
jgi:hypothetical protein